MLINLVSNKGFWGILKNLEHLGIRGRSWDRQAAAKALKSLSKWEILELLNYFEISGIMMHLKCL